MRRRDGIGAINVLMCLEAAASDQHKHSDDSLARRAQFSCRIDRALWRDQAGPHPGFCRPPGIGLDIEIGHRVLLVERVVA